MIPHPASDPKAEVGGFFEGPRPKGPAIACEVCGVEAGVPCGHGIRLARAAFGVPLVLAMTLLFQAENGAECWRFFLAGQFAGRIERPAKPLPGRLLWGLYGPKGQLFQRAKSPKSFDFTVLLGA